MKAIIFSAASAVLLVSCAPGGSGAAADVKAGCAVIAADPEGQDAIADMGTDADGFCTCMVSLVTAMPEEDREIVKTTLGRITAEVAETGEEVEDVASRLVAEAMGAPDDVEMQAQQKGINLIGRLIDQIDNGFEDTGACPQPAG